MHVSRENHFNEFQNQIDFMPKENEILHKAFGVTLILHEQDCKNEKKSFYLILF